MVCCCCFSICNVCSECKKYIPHTFSSSNILHHPSTILTQNEIFKEIYLYSKVANLSYLNSEEIYKYFTCFEKNSENIAESSENKQKNNQQNNKNIKIHLIENEIDKDKPLKLHLEIQEIQENQEIQFDLNKVQTCHLDKIALQIIPDSNLSENQIKKLSNSLSFIQFDIAGISSSFFKTKPKFFDANIKNISDAQLYSFVNHKEELVITIRGTSSLQDVCEDLKIKKKPFLDIIYNNFFEFDPKNVPKVHSGFLTQYNTLRFHLFYIFSRYEKKLTSDKKPRVIFASHSLGGAVSTICALVMKSLFPHFDIWNYTYGSPRVGDPAFALYYHLALGKSTFRMMNNDDPIVHIPYWNYQHVGNTVSVKNGFLEIDELNYEIILKQFSNGFVKKCFSCFSNYTNMVHKKKNAHSVTEYTNVLEKYVKL